VTSPIPFHEWPVQNAVLQGLRDRIERGEVPHAMLFAGSAHETKTLIQFLAKLLLCEGAVAPCGRCDACRQFEAGTHPDYHVVNEDEGSGLKTGQVGELQEHLMLKTHSGGRMVYVIYGIDEATPAAANRLLKTLEEPSNTIIALLSCEHPRRVLPTILSRCFTYRLDTVDTHVWDDAVTISPDVLTDTSTLSSADAQENRHHQVENLSFAPLSERMLQWIETLFFSREPVLSVADGFLKSFAEMELDDALHLLGLCLRDVLHSKLEAKEYIRFNMHESALERLAHRLSHEQWIQAIERVLDARKRLQVHVAPNLNVEQLCIRLREVSQRV
jgi:DNA polymerase-3 subunit delta'